MVLSRHTKNTYRSIDLAENMFRQRDEPLSNSAERYLSIGIETCFEEQRETRRAATEACHVCQGLAERRCASLAYIDRRHHLQYLLDTLRLQAQHKVPVQRQGLPDCRSVCRGRGARGGSAPVPPTPTRAQAFRRDGSSVCCSLCHTQAAPSSNLTRKHMSLHVI